MSALSGPSNIVEVMKVKSMTAADSILGTFELELRQFDGVQVHYLVGNNGAGKSRCLDLIYSAVSGEYSGGGKCPGDSVGVSLADSKEGGSASLTFDVTEKGGTRSGGTITSGDGKQENRSVDDAGGKVVFLPAESSLLPKRVQHTSAVVPDADSMRSVKGTNLHELVPQLLVDARAMDAEDNMVAKEANRELEESSLKMSRFRAAFDEVMGGSKQFKRVENLTVYFEDDEGNEIELSGLSGGEKLVVYRLAFLVAHVHSSGAIVLIDEPEIGLHPSWQLNYVPALKKLLLGTEAQIVVATHSPFILNSFDSSHEECIRIDRLSETGEIVQLDIEGVKRAPSPALVSFLAFGVWSESVHIELFSYVMEKLRTKQIKAVNDALMAAPYNLKASNTCSSREDETLPVWVRNWIHHPEATDRVVPSVADRADSVRAMIQILGS